MDNSHVLPYQLLKAATKFLKRWNKRSDVVQQLQTQLQLLLRHSRTVNRWSKLQQTDLIFVLNGQPVLGSLLSCKKFIFPRSLREAFLRSPYGTRFPTTWNLRSNPEAHKALIFFFYPLRFASRAPTVIHDFHPTVLLHLVWVDLVFFFPLTSSPCIFKNKMNITLYAKIWHVAFCFDLILSLQVFSLG